MRHVTWFDIEESCQIKRDHVQWVISVNDGSVNDVDLIKCMWKLLFVIWYFVMHSDRRPNDLCRLFSKAMRTASAWQALTLLLPTKAGVRKCKEQTILRLWFLFWRQRCLILLVATICSIRLGRLGAKRSNHRYMAHDHRFISFANMFCGCQLLFTFACCWVGTFCLGKWNGSSLHSIHPRLWQTGPVVCSEKCITLQADPKDANLSAFCWRHCTI